MTVVQTKYFPGKYGLATEYSFSEMPLEYLRKFTNRFINLKGDAEKRQGMERIGAQITGQPEITGIHEYVDPSGNDTLFASAAGTIWRYNETTAVWNQVLTGKDVSKRLISVQMVDKLIFVNGSDRNFYTDDGGTTFKELKAVMEQGVAASGTDQTNLKDASITNWLSTTYITNNDLVYNSTLGAYGFVTSVGASNIVNTQISTTAKGAIGVASRTPASGDIYEVTDLIELNIIPTGVTLDNFGTATTGTTDNVIAVSGVNFANTQIRTGDMIYNTTRNGIARVTSVSANINVTGVSAQVPNDTITFFKSAMPIAAWPHVHYGRFYVIDARNRGEVRYSGPADPQDFTTSQITLQTASQAYNSRQPQAESILCLETFQQYLVAGGERNVYIDSGINPSATSAQAVDFQPVGLFPQGCVSRFALESIGGAMIFGANDGIRNFNAVFNNQTFQAANLSEPIKSEISRAIASKVIDSADEVQAIHYPRRNWLLFKVGDVIYNYNYSPFYSLGKIETQTYGSFSTFTGKFAQQKVYYIRRNGDLICGGANGSIYEFDKGNYDDDGEAINTTMETSFLKLTEPEEGTQSKSGVYIKPVFETSQPITYTIEATGDFDSLGTDTATAVTQGVGMVGFGVVGASPVGGNRVYDQKLPLRWKGEQFKIRISTSDSKGPDIITGYVIYGNVLGKQ